MLAFLKSHQQTQERSVLSPRLMMRWLYSFPPKVLGAMLKQKPARETPEKGAWASNCQLSRLLRVPWGSMQTLVWEQGQDLNVLTEI